MTHRMGRVRAAVCQQAIADDHPWPDIQLCRQVPAVQGCSCWVQGPKPPASQRQRRACAGDEPQSIVAVLGILPEVDVGMVEHVRVQPQIMEALGGQDHAHIVAAIKQGDHLQKEVCVGHLQQVAGASVPAMLALGSCHGDGHDDGRLLEAVAAAAAAANAGKQPEATHLWHLREAFCTLQR